MADGVNLVQYLDGVSQVHIVPLDRVGIDLYVMSEVMRLEAISVAQLDMKCLQVDKSHCKFDKGFIQDKFAFRMITDYSLVTVYMV